MIKIAIVESNKEATQKIKDLIAKYEIQLGIAFDVKTFMTLSFLGLTKQPKTSMLVQSFATLTTRFLSF